MSQTVNPKGILSVLQNLPSPDKTQSLLALTAPRLWQIWFEKAGNKNEHHCSSLSRPRWEDGAALCAIWSMSSCKWIKKIHWFSPPSVRTSHWNVPKSLLSAKLCVNFWAFHADWQPLRTDCPLNNLQFCQKWEHIGKIRVSGLWEQCCRDTLILWTLCGFLKAMNSSSSKKKKKKDHVFIKDFVSSSGEAKSHLNDDCLSMH